MCEMETFFDWVCWDTWSAVLDTHMEVFVRERKMERGADRECVCEREIERVC